MMRTSMIGLGLVLSCCLTHTAEAQKKVPDGAKVFLLSGGQREHHGYRDQAFYLASTLENTGRFQVTIGEDAAILETPAIRKYDLLIVSVDRRDPDSKFTKAQQEAIFEFVRSGHGYVSIHGGDNAAGRLAPGLERDARRDLLPHRPARRQGPRGTLHRQDRRHLEPDHSGAQGLQAEGRALLQHADDARRPAAGHDRVSRRRLAGGLDADLRQGPGVSHQSRPSWLERAAQG